MRGVRTAILLVSAIAMTLSAFAFAPVPKESARALKVTRGKPFYSGVVFVNGKYVEPPYVVERWGTGIRINGIPVTGQVIDWNEFLKTQANVKVTKQESAEQPPVETKPVETSSPAAPAEDVNASSLDDLFDDNPKPKKSIEVRKSVVTVEKPAVVAPKQAVVTYAMEGEFVPNDATRKMLGRINAVRTEIDRTIRSDGFICFGDTYSQVSGDSRTLLDLLEKLPDLQKNAKSEQDFCERIRGSGLVYLNEVLRTDLYRNRVDYRKLQERRTKMKRDSEILRMINDVSTPLL